MLTFEVLLDDKQVRDQRQEEAPFDEVLDGEVPVQVHQEVLLQNEEQGQESFRPIFHWTIPIDVWEC